MFSPMEEYGNYRGKVSWSKTETENAWNDGEGMNQQSCHAANNGAVDADELQVPADLKIGRAHV